MEINAGTYYLRQLRAVRHIDDRPLLMEAFADPTHRKYVLNYRLRTLDEATEYVALRAAQWAGDERCSWAIAEPTSGRRPSALVTRPPTLSTSSSSISVSNSSARSSIGSRVAMR